MALNDFKNQLDTLSESLHHLDPVEQNKALEFLQECIHGLETKTNSSAVEESYEEINNLITSDKNEVNGTESSLSERGCEELNICNMKTEDEESHYTLQIDEENELQSDEDWKQELKCPQCKKGYDDTNSFLEHLQTYTGKIKSCVDCHKEFNNSSAFKFHKYLAKCVKSSKIYKCKLCNKTLFGWSQYTAHMSAHKRNQCKICGDHLATRKHLEIHMVNLHKGSLMKNSFRCHLCKRPFAQRRSLVYHYKNVHPDQNVMCSVCLETFECSSKLEAHQAIHKLTTYVCNKCDEQFSRKQQYLVHLSEHERYKCKTCNMSFAAKKKAMQHTVQGHNVSGLEPQLQCAQCGQMFHSRLQLKNHMLHHIGGKILACEKCKVTFKHERNYRSHLLTNEHLHGEAPKILLSCRECNKTFTNRNNLKVHTSRMHKTDLKEHMCTLCSYKTTVPNNLKRHIDMHTKKPQFICDKCGSQFQTKNSLREHLIYIHSNTKDFSCDKCGKLFSRSSDLNRHLINTHSDSPQYTCHCGNGYKTLSNLKRHQLLSHGKVDPTQKRLEKLFPLESNDPPKKKRKKSEINTNVDDVHLMNSQMPTISSPITQTDSVVMMVHRDQEELLQVSYNMDFPEESKTQVVYTENLDMEGLQVVQSMIQLENDNAKQSTSVVLNVRNMFSRPDYVIPPSIDSSVITSLENSLSDTSQPIVVANQKQVVISGLQEYILPQELNFLNV